MPSLEAKEFDDEGARQLALALEKNSTLADLDLYRTIYAVLHLPFCNQ